MFKILDNRPIGILKGKYWIFLLPILILMMFDHYLFSLWTGMVVLGIWLGIIFRCSREFSTFGGLTIHNKSGLAKNEGLTKQAEEGIVNL